ncbi:hypothetical protein IVA87_32225 [Bradyrhizobium sp. 147]|uniref:hypothetical protein n=1 Tax=unclassified Bradyrhizobium TaxID=2631580 RepID=UPI001FFA204E|nr:MULTISPECIES: hypothetical protein [unclassified Bradyrhizobium]MCK1544566.1 hypothetical protein [Bradyrhizobium sp. 179]MCK1683923.1 hypothetical protein [Bradyrhizobium sp. 147]MCK1758856.1 hypothetical protein [Bradyrhizobium sp. 137]
MMKFLMIALVTTVPVLAQVSSTQNPPFTDREQVKHDRAKAAEAEKSAPTTRPWDRDADGKRPWDQKPSKP